MRIHPATHYDGWDYFVYDVPELVNELPELFTLVEGIESVQVLSVKEDAELGSSASIEVVLREPPNLNWWESGAIVDIGNASFNTATLSWIGGRETKLGVCLEKAPTGYRTMSTHTIRLVVNLHFISRSADEPSPIEDVRADITMFARSIVAK